MCLSKAYVDRNGERELVMAEVASLKVEADKLRLTTLFGEHKKISATIREIDFLTHSIILENK
jgi:predicted RNA-binding protein